MEYTRFELHEEAYKMLEEALPTNNKYAMNYVLGYKFNVYRTFIDWVEKVVSGCKFRNTYQYALTGEKCETEYITPANALCDIFEIECDITLKLSDCQEITKFVISHREEVLKTEEERLKQY